MSRYGLITIECDTPGCHAEQVLPAESFSEVVHHYGFSLSHGVDWLHKDGKDICPQCVEEGKA